MWWWEACWKKEKKHLRLAFECEGGGSAKRRVETPKKKRSQLAFGREESGGEDVPKRLKKTLPARWTRGKWWKACWKKENTSGSPLNAREVVVAKNVSKPCKNNYVTNDNLIRYDMKK